MRYLIVSLILFIHFMRVHSQPQFRPYLGADPLHTYGNVSIFPTLNNQNPNQVFGIAEDFGPRQLGADLYQWHGGIDYNSDYLDADYGDLILALEGGTISEHSQMVSGTKSLIIEGNGPNGHNLRYVHVFTGGNLTVSQSIVTGGCILKVMDYPNNNISQFPGKTWAIIIRDNGNYIAYGPEPPMPPGQVTFTDENGVEHTLTVNTQVAAGAPVVPLGDSNNFPAHLHLEILTQVTDDNGNNIPAGDDRWAKDPLQLYDHDAPNYNIGFYYEDDETSGIDIIYPGTNEGTVQVHVEMSGQENNNPANRYDVVMNVDEVAIYIKPVASQNFNLIQGPNFRSEFSHGARIGTERINMDLNVASSNVGDWNRTHMQPFAYATNNSHPRDDYYFADFLTRIHKDDPMDGSNSPTMIAYCPDEARYNDGVYLLKARVTDVRDSVFESGVEVFTLDNFKPYVKEVEVKIGDTLVYEKGWECDTSCGDVTRLTFWENTALPVPSVEMINSGQINVRVETSEPLQWLSLQLVVPGNDTFYVLQEIEMMVADASRQLWEVNLSDLFLTGGVEYFFTFDGRDFPPDPINSEGNELLNLEQFIDGGDCVLMPVRFSVDGAWQNIDLIPYGIDFSHVLFLPCYGENGGFKPTKPYKVFAINAPCLLPDFEFYFDSDSCYYVFNDLSQGDVVSWHWDFGDGMTSQEPNVVHAFNAETCYDVTLTITDSTGVSSFVTKEICAYDEKYFYLRKVVVFAKDQASGDSTMIYKGEWLSYEYFSNCVFFEGGSLPYDLNALSTKSIVVHAFFTEELLEVPILELSGLNYFQSGFLMDVSNNGYRFEFDEGVLAELASTGSIQLPLIFTAVDVSGNSLLDLRVLSHDMTICAEIPEFLYPECEWTSTPLEVVDGEDVHVLEIYCDWVDFEVHPNLGAIALLYENTMPYVTWSGPGITEQNLNDSFLMNLPPGEYCANLKFPSNCSFKECVFLPPPLEVHVTGDSPCPGEQDGSLCAYASGGSGVHIFIWDIGSYGKCVTGLSASDSVCVSVYDLIYNESANSCFFPPAYVPLYVALDYASSTCPFSSNGTICVDVAGGNLPVMLEWDTGDVGSCFEAAEEGQTYCVIATDVCGEEIQECFSIPPYVPISIDSIVVESSLTHCSTGSIALYVSGGIVPYSYTWIYEEDVQNAVTTASPFRNLLLAGHYQIIVEDACGNTSIVDAVLEGAGNSAYYVNTSFDVSHVCFPEDSTGEIDLILESNSPYEAWFSYLWNTGAQTQDITGLTAGTYIVTITHPFDGCEYIDSVVVDVIGVPADSIDVVATSPDCLGGGNDGAIYLNLHGYYQIHAMDISWSNGMSGMVIQGLDGGDYTVSISYNGCESEAIFTVETIENNLDITGVEIINSSFYTVWDEETNTEVEVDNHTGSISISVSGDYPPFTYQWSDANGAIVYPNNLASGTYWVTVTDALGCSVTESFTVASCPPGYIALDFSPLDITPCAFNVYEGSMAVSVSGQYYPPLSYSWSGPSGSIENNESLLTGLLEEGMYCVTVSDICGNVAFGCQDLTCHCEDAFEISLSVENPCMDFFWEFSNTADIYLNINAKFTGADNYCYYIKWIGPNEWSYEGELCSSHHLWVPSVEGLSKLSKIGKNYPQGTYCVSVINENGCQKSACVTVSDNAVTTLLVPFSSELPEYEQNVTMLNQLPGFSDIVFGGTNTVELGCTSVKYCGSTPVKIKDVQVDYQLIPNNSDAHPCYAGGLIYCGYDEDYEVLVYEAPPNSLVIPIDEGGECGCLFLPGSLISNQLPGFYGFVNDNYVYVKYDCAAGANSETPLDSLFGGECPCQGACVTKYVGNCEAIWYCSEDSLQQPIPVSYGGNIVTFVPLSIINCTLRDGNLCRDVIQCAADPCDIEPVSNFYPCPPVDSILDECFLCPNGIGGYAELEENVFFLQNEGRILKSYDNEAVILVDKEFLPSLDTLSIFAYPMPFKNRLFVLFGGESSIGKLEIIDIYGRNILSMEIKTPLEGHLLELNFPEPLPTGTYLLTFTYPDGSIEILKLLHQ